jgi:hypothetical protein
MSLQAVINNLQELKIDRRRIIGVQMTRNEIPKVSSIPTRNPWRLEASVHEGIPYNEARAMLEELDNLDRELTETVTFSNNTNLSWMFRYQGSMSELDISNVQVGSFSGINLTLINLPALTQLSVLPDGTTETNYFFRKGDLIQIKGSPYPFSIIQDYDYTTITEARTLTVKVHRPNFITANVQNAYINVGANCEWKLLCDNMPTYSIVNGAARYNQYGILINNGRVVFDDTFRLIEDTSTA